MKEHKSPSTVSYKSNIKATYKCNKCGCRFDKDEIVIKSKSGSNISDRDKTSHCPKCHSEYFTLQ